MPDPPRPLNRDVSANVIKRALHAANNMVVLVDPRQDDFPIVWVNDHFTAFTGYTREEVLGRNCRFLQGEDRDQPERHRLRAAIDKGEPVNVLLKNYKKDGTLFYNDLYVSPVYDDDGALAYFIGVQNNVTAREEARSDLRDREREVAETAENERERFGMDLHDGLGQVLSGVRMMADVLYQDLDDEENPYAEDAQRLVDYIADAQQEAKRMARGLNPVDASPDGLGHALRLLAERAEQGNPGLKVTPRVEAVDFADRRVARHLYRIAQEALNNAVKYADADHIILTLHNAPGAIHLEINDDGRGLTPDLTERVNTDYTVSDYADNSGDGMGLHGMRYRAQLIGAKLTASTAPHGGTLIRVVYSTKDGLRKPQHVRTAERE